MGEMADMLINGDCDFYTGEYIGRGGGYPRTHNRSLDWERGCQWDRDTNINGVNVFLIKQGYNYKLHTDIAREYAFNKGWQCKKMKAICAEIQKDWLSFKEYIINNKAQTKTT